MDERDRRAAAGDAPSGRPSGPRPGSPGGLALVMRTAAALAPLLAPACGGSGGGGGAPPAPPVVTLVSTTCPSGVGNLPDTTCLVLRVDPPTTTGIDVELRVTEPTPGVPLIGTAVVLSGGSGAEFFADITGGEALLAELADLGLRVVDRRWEGGWLQAGTSITAESSRLPELLDWIHANQHQGGLFFAIGNSGGAGELGYALTTWGREVLFDAVAFLGGPPYSRLDLMCLPPSGAWNTQCPAIFPTMECGVPPCSGESTSLCGGVLSQLTAAELLAESILHPGADTDFGGTPMHMILGADDCTEWVASALLFESAVTSTKTFQLVPGTPHGVTATPQGRDAVIQALLGFVPFPSAPPPLPVGLSVLLLEDGEPRARARGLFAPR